jgi:hypothetical protein
MASRYDGICGTWKYVVPTSVPGCVQQVYSLCARVPLRRLISLKYSISLGDLLYYLNAVQHCHFETSRSLNDNAFLDFWLPRCIRRFDMRSLTEKSYRFLTGHNITTQCYREFIRSKSCLGDIAICTSIHYLLNIFNTNTRRIRSTSQPFCSV